MSTTREGVNPLRPYYVPPTIGASVGTTPSQPNPNPFSQGSANTTAAGTKYASKARDIFPDLDYKDYINDSSPSGAQAIKSLLDELLWKYTSVLMAQPFEVAKTILQVRMQDDLERIANGVTPVSTPRQASFTEEKYDQYPDSDSDDEQSYFTSNAPYTASPSTRVRVPRLPSPTDPPKQPKKADESNQELALRRPDSVFDVISQLWLRESAWGVWKGTNATFLYNVLQSLLENWSRSLLSALLNVPDLGVKDDVDRLIDIASPYPWLSLCVAAAASVATGVILAPLDMVRTRAMVTAGRGSRRTLSTLRALPSWICPSSILAPTILNSLIHPVLTLSTPLVLRSQFLIDRQLSPNTFSVAKFCTSVVSLFVKLPLETVLRRGQVAVLSETLYARALDKSGRMDLVVTPGLYKGVWGTAWHIMNEEGSRAMPLTKPASTRGRKEKNPKIAKVVYKKGQGVDGLWRGWKVSWWGLVGLWSAGIVGGGGEGEF